MLSEVLLVLSGYPSSFFIPHPPAPALPTTLTLSPSLSQYLHPGEIASLETLGQLAFRYRYIRDWALSVQAESRNDVLLEASRKGKERADPANNGANGGVYLSTLVAGILGLLREYELLLVETEARVLAIDPELVQDGRSYVPLSTLIAVFDGWQPVLASLSDLVGTLSKPSAGDIPWTPGRLIHHISGRCQTGNPRLHDIYSRLLSGLWSLFLTHLTAFILFGLAPYSSTPTSPAIGIDAGPDPLNPRHRLYKLNDDLFPPSISGRTRESILYIGRVAATLKREGRSLPVGVVANVREEVMAVDDLEGDGLDSAISRARAEIGEWLWKNVLTGRQVKEAIETFGDYFLLRKADFALSLIRELHHLSYTKLLKSNPRSSTSVIRESDLNNVLLRASLGTSAETDPNLEKLGWKLENGPIRPIMPSVRARQPTAKGMESGTRDLFASSVMGAPLELRCKVGWPLDLFMTPSAISAYSDIHSYLFALQDTHTRLSDSWKRLSEKHRQRQRPTTADEKDMVKATWSISHAMLFFLDQLLGHFTIDIIDVQHRRLVEDLDIIGVNRERQLARSESGISPSASMRGSIRPKTSLSRLDSRSQIGKEPDSPTSDGFDAQTVRSKGTPPTPRRRQATFLDFLTLRQMHTRHLAFLRDGLLLTDRNLAALIRDMVDTCKRFTGLVDRWGGTGLPEALSTGSADTVRERLPQMRDIGKAFNEQLADFYRALLETQNPIAAKDDASSSGTVGTSFSKTARTIQMSRLMNRQDSFPLGRRAGDAEAKTKSAKGNASKGIEAESAIGRHVEQLLLRLDFNGVITSWIEKEEEGGKSRNVLTEGGL